jgi:hypothetical protein
MKITEESFHLMIRYLIAQYEQQPKQLQRKHDKSAIEDAASQCALMASALAEVLAEYPIDSQTMDDTFVKCFVEGDMNLEVLLQSCIQEKKRGWKPIDLPPIADIIQAHSHKSGERVHKGPMMAAAALEAEEYELFIKKANYDLQCHAVYSAHVSSHEHNIYMQRAKHRADRHKACVNKATALLDRKSPHYKICVELAKVKTTENLQLVLNFQRAISLLKNRSPDDPASVTSISVLNWAAPSTVSANMQRIQAEMLGVLVNTPEAANMGIMVSPTYARQKGMLWKIINACSEKLSKSNVNVDLSFGLLYDCRADARDTM